MTEIGANNPTSTLNGSITSVATSLIVLSSTGFPLTGNFRIRIDNEIMKVTSVSGNTFTTVRASEPYQGVQAATSHANFAPVIQVVTAEGLNQFTAVQVGGETIIGLGTPTIVSVLNAGALGSNTYTYKITALSQSGGETAASFSTSITSGASTLNGTTYNIITWNPIPRAISYNVYRTASNGNPSSTGKIANVPITSSTPTVYNDQGISGDGATAPSTDTSYYSGVNTTNPSQAWDVSGNIRATGTVTVGTSATVGAGLNVGTGLNVNVVGTPSNSIIRIGDTNFYLDGSQPTNPVMAYDNGAYWAYSRSGQVLTFNINNTFMFAVDITGTFTSLGDFHCGGGIDTDRNTTSTIGNGIHVFVGDGVHARTFEVTMRLTGTTFQLFATSGVTNTQWAIVNSTAGWSAGSSRALKDDITDVTPEQVNELINKLISTKLKTYYRKDDKEGKLEYGLIAEEAPEEILGDLDKTTVNPMRWLGFTTVILQDSAKRIQELERKNSDLEIRLSKLERYLNIP